MSNENIQDELRTKAKVLPSIDGLLNRGVSTILPETNDVKDKLRNLLESQRCRAYLGIDPTGDKLHIGHEVPLRKLRIWQDLGHEAVLLMGGFTATIGDPKSGSIRKRLTTEQVAENMKDYYKQAGKILDTSPNCVNQIVTVNNNEWLSKMGFAEIVELASNFTVQQMLGHITYKERIESGKPLSLHEILYFLMQAEDAKHLQTDVQFGGTEQTFNIASGITLIRRELNRDSFGLITKLIADAKGRKMGKTEGNVIALVDLPEVKYEAVMTWPDELIPLGFELLTSVPMEKVAIAELAISDGRLHPNEMKRALAFRLTAELDGENEALFAELEYDRVYKHGQPPSRIQIFNSDPDLTIAETLIQSGLAIDIKHASQLIANQSVFIDGGKAKANMKLAKGEHVFSIGKRTIKNIRKVIV